MSIRAKFGLRKKKVNKVHKNLRSLPVCTDSRTQSLSSLYCFKDFLIDLIRHYTIKQGVYHPHLPTLIVDYVPIYNWLEPQNPIDVSELKIEESEDLMKVKLSHCDTIVCNSFQKFGAVLGSKLDPRLDHVINIKLVDGVEFGVGICDESHLSKVTKRDFMCIDGGYGYYNYKTKSTRMKPKYPPGFYYQVQSCRQIRSETDIFRAGDVLTMVIQRENVTNPGGGVNLRSRCERDLKFNPMDNLKASSTCSLSFYKNGEDMGFHLRNLKGPFHICLNYYFVDSKLRFLSDYNFRKIHRRRNRQRRKHIAHMTNITSVEARASSHRRNESAPYRFQSIMSSNVL